MTHETSIFVPNVKVQPYMQSAQENGIEETVIWPLIYMKTKNTIL